MSDSFDASGFLGMCAGLAQFSGKEMEPILVDQIGQLMGVCIRYTHGATRESIAQGVRFKNSRYDIPGGPKVSLGIRKGNDWFLESSTWEKSSWQRTSKTTGGTNASGSSKPPKMFGRNTAHLMNGNRRWSDERWARFQMIKSMMAEIEQKPAEAAKSRGLSKLTWQQIADAIGAGDKTKAPGYVRNAKTFKGKQVPEIGTAQAYIEAAAFYIEIRNESEILTKGPSPRFKGPRQALDGFQILQKAMDTRVSAYEHDLTRGTFKNLATSAQRYPGIFTS
jgi:hypothetical protein